MSNVLVNEEYLSGIANAIRAKNGSSDTYTPGQMASAIGDISGGGSATLITKTVTANGTYSAEDDSADGYSSVTVSLPTYPMSGGLTAVAEPSLASTTFTDATSSGVASKLASILNLNQSNGQDSTIVLSKGSITDKGISVKGSYVYLTTTNGQYNLTPSLSTSSNHLIRYACTDLAGIALWTSDGREPMEFSGTYYCGWALCTSGHYVYFVGTGAKAHVACSAYSYYDLSLAETGTRAFNLKSQGNYVMLAPFTIYGNTSNNLLVTSMYPERYNPMTFTMGGHKFVAAPASNNTLRSRLVVRLGPVS